MSVPGAALPASRLLAALPRAARDRFISGCDVIALEFEEVLALPGAEIEHVYFPLDSYISQLTPVAGPALEIALTGNEGMLGLPVALGVRTSAVRAIVQGRGTALRMKARAFRGQLEGSDKLRLRMARYSFVSLTQIGHIAACNRFHPVDQRLARWLLMTADRAHSLSFHVTHAYLAYMLGVRRVGITLAAAKLQSIGLINYSRGRITVIDLPGLKRTACACYQASLDTYDSVLGNGETGIAAFAAAGRE